MTRYRFICHRCCTFSLILKLFFKASRLEDSNQPDKNHGTHTPWTFNRFCESPAAISRKIWENRDNDEGIPNFCSGLLFFWLVLGSYTCFGSWHVQMFLKIVASGAEINYSTYSVLLKSLLAAGNWRKYIEVIWTRVKVAHESFLITIPSFLHGILHTGVSCTLAQGCFLLM